MNVIHKFGKRVDGRLGTFFGTLRDAEFCRVTRYGLPPGWVAWHVEESEIDDPSSPRVVEISELPILCGGFYASLGHGYSSWREAWRYDMGCLPGNEPPGFSEIKAMSS